MKGICKAFGTNQVLKGIDLEVQDGEVLALIGGNGAGKSTLMKIIMGIYQQDSGEIAIGGKKVHLSKPSVALVHGVYLVPQEPMLFPNMTLEENVLMGFKKRKTELINRLNLLLKQLGWKLDLTRKAESLSIAEQQLVEILRGLMRHAKILILDEPTSSLTFKEVQSLFKLIETLKVQQISIIYITHRLVEVFQIATRVAIMRDGKITLSGPVGAFNQELLVKGLLPPNSNEKQEEVIYKPFDYSMLKPILYVHKLNGFGFCDISFCVYLEKS